MKFVSKYFYILFLSLLSFNIIAQEDLNLAQYHNTPFLTNPAMVAEDNYMKLFLNYRSQPNVAGENFTTIMLNGVYPLINRWTGKRWGGIGIGFLRDQPGQFLTSNGIVLGYAHNIQIVNKEHRHYISPGIQGAYVNRSLSFSGLSTEAQLVGGVVDPTLPLGENVSNNSRGYFTITPGVMWTMENALGQRQAYAGVSYFNVNNPETSFYNEREDNLPSHWIVTSGVVVYRTDMLIIEPTFRWINRSGSDQFNFGTWGRYKLPSGGFIKDGWASLGLWYNFNNSFIATAQFEQPNYLLAFNFDFATSDNATKWQGNSVFEITIGLRLKREAIALDTPQIEPIDDFSVNDAKPSPVDLSIKPVDVPKRPKPKTKSGEEDGAFRFEKGSSELDARSKELLDSVALVMMEYPEATIEVTGHTCDLGSEADNEELSRKRAEVMKEYLVQHDGISPDRIKVSWKGERSPLVPNTSEPNRVKNRRVAYKMRY